MLFLKLIVQQVMKGHLYALKYFRYYSRWKTSLQAGHNSMNDRLPWLSFPAIDLLQKKLTGNEKVFEYGGGGSTLFFADKAAEVITVEHNRQWFDFLMTDTNRPASTKWKPVLILPEEKKTGIALDYTNPDHYYTSDSNFVNNTFQAYASYIDKYADEYFDIVLVDGRARPSCLKHALRKVKKGGLLILDNAERSYYLNNNELSKNHFKLILDEMAPVPFINFFSQTNAWIKQPV